MKIIVNNESEQKLLRRFLDLMHDLDGVEEMSKIDDEFDDANESTYLEGGDALFLERAVLEAKVVIDNSESPICIEHDNLQGTCAVCGTATDGTIDGDDISYDEWLDYHSESGLKQWKCEGCLNKSEE